MVRPMLGPNDREPELITHHAHNGSSPDDFDYDDDPYTGEQSRFNEFGQDDDDYDDEPELDENGKKIKPVLTPQQLKKRRWRRIRRTLYVFVGLFFVAPAIAFTIMYFIVTVPSPESVAAQQNQPISYFYSDGSLMGKVLPSGGGGNRVPLQVGQITDTVKHAAYAAEDASFETNSGFDVIGILRAVYNQLTGGTGGGSTISQQYIKQATQNDAPTLTRKATELVKSFKMNNQDSKEEIITAYLNTIYFGRGASGIQAASQAYFKKDAKDLSPSESALLAGMIQGPSRYKDMTYMTKRWNYVMDMMVKYNWITKAYRDSSTFPTPVPLDDGSGGQSTGAPNYFIQQRIQAELDAEGFPEEKLFSGGYKVYTTIDPAAQKAAEQAVADGMKGQTDPQILNALVAVDPKTGGVLAYYGGPTVVKDANGKDQLGQDHADQARNPGSSIKAFDLTAFLKLGKGLGETFDGTSPRTFPGVAKPIRNAGDSDSCSKECTVAEAMKISANTVFYDMVFNVTKPQGVATAATEAGVQTAPDGKAVMGMDNNISLGGGSTVATPEDMASAYATFAGDGLRHPQHFVAKLTNSSDEVAIPEVTNPGTPAFAANDPALSKQIAGNVTQALEPVIGFSKLKCPTGHECAGKTGTQQYEVQSGDPASAANANAQTWMVGYTPSVSAAAWVGGDGNKALHDKNGRPVFGSTIAGPIWQNFMQLYLNGKPPEKFPVVQPIGKDVNATPSTTPPPPPITPTTTYTTPPADTTTTETPTSTTSTTTKSKPPKFGPPTTSSTSLGGGGGGFGGPPTAGGGGTGGGGASAGGGPNLLPSDPASG
jgi:membrane peptidoglycan carboxypeptidase